MESRVLFSIALLATLAGCLGDSSAGRSKGSSQQPPVSVERTAASPAGSLRFDKYGGLLDVPSPNGSNGRWRAEKFGKRWLFVTPDGHAFWSFGVFNIVADEHTDDLGNAYKTRVMTKYGNADLAWGPQQVRRLRSWGFNTILDHSVNWVRPTQTCGGCPGWPGGVQPEKMPQIWFVDGASYPIRNMGGYGKGNGKDIFQGVDTTYYKGYIAPNTDPFDPNFAIWINGYLGSAEARAQGSSPWTIGFSLAEMDYLWGFGAGSVSDFSTVPSGHNNPHIGYIALITSPTQTTNRAWGVTYSDTTVYAKQALKNFLQSRYGTITALNRAWNGKYSSFDSDGGWGRDNSGGTLTSFGLLDENGSSPWVPRDWDTLKGATPALRQDLDDFLFLYAEKWFSTQRNALKSRFPDLLYFGPNVVGSWGTPPRKQILQAAGRYIDVFMTQIGTGSADDQQRLDFTMRFLGGKPIATWVGFPANPDSSLWRYPNPSTYLASQTQAKRGEAYERMVKWLSEAKCSSSIPDVGDTHPIVGLRWWAWVDNPGEKTNWGLVTTSDNAYDGKEAVAARGVDRWGYRYGGEERDYGDFLSAVRRANLNILGSLLGDKKAQ